jgi:uroporphyrinogen-III synthase
MSARVIAIRPEPGLSDTLELGAQVGLLMEGIALSRAVPCAWDAPNPADFDAILAGSANAFRHGGEGLLTLKSLPVLAVGSATAEAAREAGFTVEHIGTGGLQGVIDQLAPQNRRLLRLSGKDHVALSLPQGIKMESPIVYAMAALPLSKSDSQKLSQGAIVVLFSAVSARHFRAECERLGLDISHLTIAALGPRIAEAAGEGWASVHHADTPDTPSLLALAQNVCQA